MQIRRDVTSFQTECIILEKGDVVEVLDGELAIITDPMTAIAIKEASRTPLQTFNADNR